MAVQISIEHNNKTIYCIQTTHQALHHDRHVSLALCSVTFGTLVAWGCIAVCKLTPCLSHILFCPLRRQGAYRNFIHTVQLYKPYKHMGHIFAHPESKHDSHMWCLNMLYLYSKLHVQ